MKPIRRILAVTDFSPDADKAVARAERIARSRGVALVLLHVVSDATLAALRELSAATATDMEHLLAAEIQGALERSAAEIAARGALDMSTEVSAGGVVTRIAAAAERADLLVLGARGTNPVQDIVLGTTAERLLQKSSCPALVVRCAADADYTHALAAIDDRAGAQTLLSAAAHIAPVAQIDAVHAVDMPYEARLRLFGVSDSDLQSYRRRQNERASSAISRWVADAGAASGCHCVPVLAQGNPIQALLAHQQRSGANPIIIGKRRARNVADFLLGSVTRHVLADAACDVLVVTCDDEARDE